jgi:hypothetical protein
MTAERSRQALACAMDTMGSGVQGWATKGLGGEARCYDRSADGIYCCLDSMQRRQCDCGKIRGSG